MEEQEQVPIKQEISHQNESLSYKWTEISLTRQTKRKKEESEKQKEENREKKYEEELKKLNELTDAYRKETPIEIEQMEDEVKLKFKEVVFDSTSK